MNPNEKNLLEVIQLNTINKMIDNKNINVLSVIQHCKEKNLFFNDFYETIFINILTQYQFNDFILISSKYKDFGLSLEKANKLMNNSIKNIKYHEFREYFGTNLLDSHISSLFKNKLFLDDYNLERLISLLNHNPQPQKNEIIINNNKIKEYVKLSSSVSSNIISQENKINKL